MGELFVRIDNMTKEEKIRLLLPSNSDVERNVSVDDSLDCTLSDVVALTDVEENSHQRMIVRKNPFQLQGSNLLFWGDNKDIMRFLLRNGWREKITLIYADPPFFTGSTFKIKRKVSVHSLYDDTSRTMVTEHAYTDNWRKNMGMYLNFMKERLMLMRELLSAEGALYLHCDWHVGHYLKVMLDEIFGYENFRNEIVVKRIKKSNPNMKKFNVATDSIFFYTKSEHYLFNKVAKTRLKKPYWHALDAPGQGEPRIFFGKRIEPPPGRHWMWTQEKIDRAIREGKVRLNPRTQKPEYLVEGNRIQYLDSDWTDISAYSFSYGFETEKNEELLRRIILTSSRPNDIVADFFCGSGTTLAVAEKLGRRWIGVDSSYSAIQLTKKRLLTIDQSKKLAELSSQKVTLYGKKVSPFEIWECRPPFSFSKLLKKYNLYPKHATPNFSPKTFPIFVLKGKNASENVVKMILNGDIRKKTTELVSLAKENGFQSVNVIHVEWELHDANYYRQLGNTLSIQVIPLKLSSPHNTLTWYSQCVEAMAKNNGKIPATLMKTVPLNEIPYVNLQVEHDMNGKQITVIIKDVKYSIHPPFPSLKHKKTQKNKKNTASPISNPIDCWTIDWNYGGNVFYIRGFFCQSKKLAALPLEVTHNYKKKGRYIVKSKFIDVYGASFMHSFAHTVE